MFKHIKMPLWGPYSKKYMGISRIIDKRPESGARFDFIPHPTVWNSSTPVPNVTFPSGYHPWEAAGDYSYFSYRYDLVWKDKAYADVSFSKINDEAYLLRTEFVNNTERSQIFLLNVFSSLEWPSEKYASASLPVKTLFIDASDYADFAYAVKRPWENQNPDGMEKGVFIDPEFVGGKGLGDRCENHHVHYLNLKPFGCERGDRVSYFLECETDFSNPYLSISYQSVTNEDAVFLINGKETVLPYSQEIRQIAFPFESVKEGGFSFRLESAGAGGVELDFFAVTEREEVCDVKVRHCSHDYTQHLQTAEHETGKLYKMSFPEVGEAFYLLTNNIQTRERIVHSGCLEDALINRLSNGDVTYDDLEKPFSKSFSRKKSDDGFFYNACVHSIFTKPGENHIEYMIISKEKPRPMNASEYEEIYNTARKNAIQSSFNKQGEKYALSADILKATLLTNAVYPVYRHGENVIHHTPGKRWDNFYTWDSGFIGLGMIELNPDISEYILDTYFSEADNEDMALLLHGSLVPTQFPQYLELLNRANDKQRLFQFYGRAKLYYEFLAGRTHGSTTAKFHNGLTTTYDYWYSTSGMDDYPAQVEMMNRKWEKYCVPAISTSQVIRAGKIMKMIALKLGETEDAAIFDKDIAGFTKALQTLSWDEECGYFSYLVYDDNMKLKGFLRTEDGENLNKGMDGIYPLIAGACTPRQQERVLAHIKNPEEMWSASGISAVDLSAGYYKNNGYWNGNVWMSHQWFLWKTMLDLGDGDFAFEIANRALEIWRAETDDTYYTYECFSISTQRGGWFHNFGGLSAPICIWFHAYYKPGTLATGLDLWVNRQTFKNDGAVIDFEYFGGQKQYTVIVTLSDRYAYTAVLNGKPAAFKTRHGGTMEFTFDGSVKSGILKIEKK